MQPYKENRIKSNNLIFLLNQDLFQILIKIPQATLISCFTLGDKVRRWENRTSDCKCIACPEQHVAHGLIMVYSYNPWFLWAPWHINEVQHLIKLNALWDQPYDKTEPLTVKKI